jgi:hypothetical protein
MLIKAINRGYLKGWRRLTTQQTHCHISISTESEIGHKLLINSTISPLGAKLLGFDLANFYLNTPMPNPKYMGLHLDIIPDKIIIHYNLCNIVTPDGWVYIKIQKGMYGLPQAGILTNQLIEQCLATKGYYKCQHTSGLWCHVWQNITFCLEVDDFGIKVTNMHNMDHLVNGLKEHNTIAVSLTGSLFCSIKLTWNYAQGHVDCHMPGPSLPIFYIFAERGEYIKDTFG